MKGLSIRSQLILITTVACAAAFLIFALAFASQDRVSIRNYTIQTLGTQAKLVGANSSVALFFGDKVAANESLQALNVDRHVDMGALYDKSGTLVASYVTPTAKLTPPRTIAKAREYSDPLHIKVLEPLAVKGESVGTVLLIANLTELEARQNSLFSTILALSGLCLFASILIAGKLQGIISEPVHKMLDTMAQVSEKKDYSLRLHVSAHGEVDRLVQGFNEMLGEIEVRDHELEDRVAKRTQALSEENNARKETEAQLEHALNEAKELADAAHSASRAKSQFLANMSHEIRTPMNGVIGLTSIMLETELTEEQLDLMQTIKSSGEALLAIINDILDFSKAEAGKFELQPEHCSLSVLIEEIGELMAQPAESKGLELLIQCDPAIPAVLDTDYGRLRQVILNLVSNAIKFTSEGEVLLDAQLKFKRDGHASIRIAVSDTGMGIPIQQQSKIFESFTQADGTTTRKHGGTGLGLTICRQIVELMGGDLTLQSEVGKGSCFSFEILLPIVQDVCESPSALSGLHFLVVDDNATNRRILCDQLGRWNCSYEVAVDGFEAVGRLSSAGEERFAAVILDMHMPGMDGAETAQKVRAGLNYRKVPIVLLSSLGTFGSREELKSAGFSGALTKPVRPSRLQHTLLVALNQTDVPATQPGPAQVEHSRKPRVLLVEDNAVNRKVAQKALHTLGFEVETANDGTEAVPMVANGRYEFILMDIQMPKMDGYAATALIRELQAERSERTPIIAMTANAMSGDREKCIEAGMDDYISKPFTRETLSQKLNRWHSAAA